MSHDFTALKNAVGSKSPVATETATPGPVAKLAATFNIAPPAAKPGEMLPPGWHDLFFGALHRPDNMRADGQVLKSTWMPEIPLRFIRIGQDRIEFPGEVRIGDELKRFTAIKEVSLTGGADDPILRIWQRSETSGPRGLAVVEEREFVYYDKDPPATAPVPVLPAPVWQKPLEPSPVLMFRYSALRLNSHRIHYDRKYAMEEEGLPGLVVQSSLLGQLLLELCRTSAPQRKIATFNRINRHPAYDTGMLTLAGAPSADGKGATMWAIDATGSPCLHGEIAFG